MAYFRECPSHVLEALIDAAESELARIIAGLGHNRIYVSEEGLMGRARLVTSWLPVRGSGLRVYETVMRRHCPIEICLTGYGIPMRQIEQQIAGMDLHGLVGASPDLFDTCATIFCMDERDAVLLKLLLPTARDA